MMMESIINISDSEDLYQIALLIDQLKHDDTNLRINASKSIIQIARALGSERTRNELIPFLSDSIDDEDEVLVVVAQKLGELTSWVGGKDHVYTLLTPLEYLISGEEGVVRDKALQSMEIIAESMSHEHISLYFIPLLMKLANRDWYTSRASAAAIFHVGYKAVRDKQNQQTRADLESAFIRLCTDETPTVRRVASQNMVNMLKLIKSPEVVTSLMAVLASFATDDQDSIRIAVIPICVALNETLLTEPSKILPTIATTASDRSWRVRWCLAHRLHELFGPACQHPGQVDRSVITTLCHTYESLLNDTEAEVRAAAAAHLSEVAKIMPKAEILVTLIPTTQRLATDSSEFVRAFFAGQINYLAPLIGVDETVTYLLPMMLQLFRDEHSEVRLNVISNITAINEVIGVELLSQSLLPAIAELAQDSKWRVRLAVIQHLPTLAKQLGREFFAQKLSRFCAIWLSDDVHSVRQGAAVLLKDLCTAFGEEWTNAELLPTVDNLYHSKANDHIESALAPMVLGLTSDPVANVRLTAAKTLQAMLTPQPKWAYYKCIKASPRSDVGGRDGGGGCLHRGMLQSVLSALSRLTEDLDRDVHFFAERALAEYESRKSLARK